MNFFIWKISKIFKIVNLLLAQDKTMRYCSIACLVSVIGLLTIWVLPNTIAFRHLLLGIGGIAAVPVIIKSRFFSGRHIVQLLPILLLLLLFFWVIVHLTFFSLNFDLEFSEVRSLWARALVGAVIATALSIVLRREPEFQKYFFTALFIVSAISIVAYLYLCIHFGYFIKFIDFVTLFVFKKIEAAFFGVISISIACANLMYLMLSPSSKQKSKMIAWWLLGIGVALVADIVSITKNGLAIGVGLSVLLAIVYLVHSMIHQSRIALKIVLPLFLIVALLAGGWQINRLFASQGWSNFVEDIEISSRIDEHSYWRKNNPIVFPMNSSGVMVSGNVYERMSWATAGVRLIKSYPMGYGSINRSFVGLLNLAKIDQQLESQTHSGWIDFALAFGLPGLALLLSAIISIIFLGLKKGGQFGLMGAWLAIGILPFGLVAEICYKHNFEILIFFITFAAASTIGMKDLKGKVLSVKEKN